MEVPHRQLDRTRQLLFELCTEFERVRPLFECLGKTITHVGPVGSGQVAKAVNQVKAETDMGVLIITHYQRILHLVKPDAVHVMFEGRIVKEGGPELVEQLEQRGYGWIRDEVAAAA